MTEGGAKRGAIEHLDKALRPPLVEVFPAAFLGRVVTIPYYPLSDDMIVLIARARLARIARQLMAGHGAELVVEEGVMALIRARCTEVESGARVIDSILTNTLLPELSRGVLSRSIEGKRLTRVTVGADTAGFTYAFD